MDEKEFRKILIGISEEIDNLFESIKESENIVDTVFFLGRLSQRLDTELNRIDKDDEKTI